MNAIELIDVSYTYGKGTPFEKRALKHVSLHVEAGDYLAIIGCTGSGKSTLIRHLNGLLRPESGCVLIGGRDIWAKPKAIRAIRFQVGVVFQQPETQLFKDTVAEDVAFGPRNLGLTEEEVGERVNEALTFVGLDRSYLPRNPFRLSGGEMRRAAIAGVLAMRPHVLVLDEPAAGLDPLGREQLYAHLDAYRRASGCTLVLVSHSMEDVAARAEHVLVLEDGCIAASGSVADIFAASEQLVSLGLDVPQLTDVLLRLRAAGYPVSLRSLSVEDAANDIMALFRARGQLK
ncbi:MAG: energy-coupling factor transporter ATPase [Sporolactobacillus sp.]